MSNIYNIKKMVLSQNTNNLFDKTKSKELAFNRILSFIDTLKIGNNEEILISDLKALMPAVSASTKKNYWSVLCDFVAKKDSRYYLNAIYVKDDKTIISSNGYVLCIVDFNEDHDMESGFYENNKRAKIKINNSNEWKYPNIEKVLIDNDFKRFSYDGFLEYKAKEIKDNKKTWVAREVNTGIWFNEQYLKLLVKDVDISINDSMLKQIENKEGHTITRIIMPCNT